MPLNNRLTIFVYFLSQFYFHKRENFLSYFFAHMDHLQKCADTNSSTGALLVKRRYFNFGLRPAETRMRDP